MRSGMDHTVFTLQTHNSCLHLVSAHQTAPPLTNGSSHLIAAYYSFIDPERMKGCICFYMYCICYVFVRVTNTLTYLLTHTASETVPVDLVAVQH